MELTRFERKILVAIAAVAVMPLLGALLLGRTALREVYQIGVNDKVHHQLESGLEVYREYIVTLREDAERTADAIVGSWELREALREGDHDDVQSYVDGALDRYPNVAAVEVRDQDGDVIAGAEVAERLDTERMRLRTQQRQIEGLDEPIMAEVTIAAPAEAFADYKRAGEVEEDYSLLLEQTSDLIKWYLAGYIGLLLFVIVVAMTVGVILSRRVTRRVADLAEATEQVGAGDLTVQVPTDARDEVGELTRAFNDMVEDLRESRERIDYLQRIGAWQEFARRLAHEIKNPLTPIQLAAQEMMQSYKGEDDRYRRNLQDACAIIEEEVSTLRRLVSEFSAFAKLPQAQLSDSDLGDFLGDVERSLPGIYEDLGLEEDDVRVAFESGGQPMPVHIDTMMLKRCVDNLVRNAMQAVRGQGPQGRVLVEARREGQWAVLEVRDDGPGLPADDRQRVFDPYFTTKTEGTGLGLAIVKKVVLEHGGEVACDEAPEGGAAFRIHLPLASRLKK